MSPSRRSSVTSTSSDSCKNQYFDFVVEVLNLYGSLPLQHLTVHLSSMPLNVRSSVGSSKVALLSFLRKHDDTFYVDSKNNISLLKKVKSSVERRRDASCESERSVKSSASMQTNSFPARIKDGKGIIFRLFPTYGFIKANEPFDTTVYFTAWNLADRTKTLLSHHDLKIRQPVGFDAVRGPSNCEARYRAELVWCIYDDDEDYGSEDDDEGIGSVVHNRPRPSSHPMRGKVREFVPQKNKISNVEQSKVNYINISPVVLSNKITSQSIKRKDKVKASSLQSLSPEDYRTVGRIQNLFPTHGFIDIVDDPGERVFFHINDIVDLDVAVTDLEDILKRGDLVDFEALSSRKGDAKVRWEATNVWIKDKIKMKSSCAKHVGPVSSECNNEGSRKKCLKREDFDQEVLETENVGKLTNSVGKIYFSDIRDKVTIHFGDCFKYKAVSKPSDIYVNGFPVENLRWEFSDGDSIMLDAIRITDYPGWKAVCAWIGEKPNMLQSQQAAPLISIPREPSLKTDEAKSVSDTSQETKLSEKYSDWGNSPYPDDDDISLPIRISKIETAKLTESNVNCDTHDEDTINKRLVDQFVSDICKSKSETPVGSEFTMSDEEDFQECIEEISKKENDNKNNISDSVSNNIQNLQREKTESPSPVTNNKIRSSCVSMFNNITGEVTKTYRRHIELKCKELEKPVCFMLTDFYDDGILAGEKCFNLKEMLSVGDEIKFNCFTIVDDNDDLWQKVTLAWKGKKPKKITKEMEPLEFIENEGLVVSCAVPDWESYKMSVVSKCIETTIFEVLPKSMRDLNEVSIPVVENFSRVDKPLSTSTTNGYSFINNKSLIPNVSQNRQRIIYTLTDSLLMDINKLKQIGVVNEGTKILEKLDTDIRKARNALPSLMLEFMRHPTLEISSSCQDDMTEYEMEQNIATCDLSSEETRCKKESRGTQTISTGEITSQEMYIE